MSFKLQFVLTAVAIFSAAAEPELARADKASVQELYRSLESDFREDFDNAEKMAETEKQRKIREGIPPINEQESRRADSVIRWVFYNRAVNVALCAEKAGAIAGTVKDLVARAKDCASERNAQILKYMKLSDDYATIGISNLKKCLIRSRDYDSETRFPPYEFLNNANDAKVYDFEKLNKCILDSL